MREAIAPTSLLTFDEFLEVEARSDVRHEFVGGMLHAMVGATERHNILAMNIGAALWNATDGVRCRVVGSDMLVRVGDDAGYYPDIVVTCDPEDVEPNFKTRPCLVVEVTSPSTLSADLRDKLIEYRRIDSLQSYLIVFQDERSVVHNYRDSRGAWQQELIAGDGAIQLHCPETTLTLDQIYRGVPDLSD